MITRTNYAKNIIANFIKKNELCIEEDNFEELNRYVLQCTDLGLALEAIGKLDEEYKEYIANRAGSRIIDDVYRSIDNGSVNPSTMSPDEWSEYCNSHWLTVRELMSILPH